MDQIVTLLTGILVAAGIFAATLFSAAQVYRQAGRLRWAHAAAALTTIAAMAALSRGLWAAAQAHDRGLVGRHGRLRGLGAVVDGPVGLHR